MNNSSPISNSKEAPKPLAPLWIFKIANPIVSALLRSPLHCVMSNKLMLITYQGRKSGKVITHPIGSFAWDQDEVMAFTSARWWVNLLEGKPVTLLIRGQSFEAIPTAIHQREAVIDTLEQFKQRLGTEAVRGLPIGLPPDREPTRADFEAAPAGIALIHFKFL